MRPRTSFVDKMFVYMKGGTGGNGLPKLNGCGGKGGDVWIAANHGESLKKLKRLYPSGRYLAGVGEHSRKFKVQGAAGQDVVIRVPPGVQVCAQDGTVVGDCNVWGDRVLGALGGDGGCAHTGYIGRPGQARQLYLILKLIADVGLVGFPNAGKSTLLRAVSKAKPKVASYPFTTMAPELGILEYPDLRRITVADLPGLIEGASRNYGLGHSFLRHVERTSLLMFVVDVNGFQLRDDKVHRDAFQTVAILNREIELYKPELLDKPAMLVVNKMDSEGAAAAWSELKQRLSAGDSALADLPAECRPQRRVHFSSIVSISAKTDADSVEVLKRKLRGCMDAHEAAPPEVDEVRRKLRVGAVVPVKGKMINMERGSKRRPPLQVAQMT